MVDTSADSGQLLSAVLRTFPDIGFVMDDRGTYVEVLASPETESLGYDDPASLEGSRIPELLPEQTATRFMNVIEDVIETGELRTIRYPMDVLEGKRWFEARIAPMETEGERDHVVWISRDITDLRTELETEARTAAAVIETIDDVFYLVDEEGYLHRWNDQLAAVTGYTDAELAELHVASLFAETSDEDVAAALDHVFEVGSLSTAVTVETKHGDRIPFSLNVHAFDHPELGTVGCGIGRDVSDRRAHERALERRTHQLRLLNRLLRHDVRNDLTTIRGGIDRLRAELDGQEAVLDRIERAGEHIVDLTETAGTLADRIDRDGDPVLASVPAEPVLTTAVASTRERYPDAAIRLEEVPDVAVSADDLLGTLLEQLLDNAVRHNDTEQPTVEVAVAADPETVTIHIADDGPGLSAQQQGSLFEDDGATTAGMGLYLVDLLVDRYDGTIDVEDNEPTGAVFSVTLHRA